MNPDGIRVLQLANPGFKFQLGQDILAKIYYLLKAIAATATTLNRFFKRLVRGLKFEDEAHVLGQPFSEAFRRYRRIAFRFRRQRAVGIVPQPPVNLPRGPLANPYRNLTE